MMKKKRIWLIIFCVIAFYIFLLGMIIGLIIYKKPLETKTPEVVFTIEKSSIIEMNASGYSTGPPYNSITKSGHSVISLGYLKIGDENIFTVASDRKVLPLGSLIYIDSLGIGMVQDTGSEIKGNDLDICFQTMDQAKQFGKKKVKVILLKKGDLK